jgi:hypothetical protein
MTRCYPVLSACLLALLMAAALPAGGQSYPAKAVRFIIPFPPGGPTDILGRVVSTRLAEAWAMPVVPDNRPGAGGNIGTEQCAKSPPDGYTVCMLSIAQTISPSIYPRLGFDPVRDLAPVTLLATLPSLLVVHPSLPARNVRELIILGRARPGALSYASGGAGTSTQLLMEWFKLEAGINIVHVPYKGSGPALVDQISGRIEVAFTTIIAVLPYIQSGRLRDRGVNPGAVSEPARRADHRGIRAQGLRRRVVAGDRDARRIAARHREQSQSGFDDDAKGARYPGENTRHGRDHPRQLSRGILGFRQDRDREMGESGESSWNQAGVAGRSAEQVPACGCDRVGTQAADAKSVACRSPVRGRA